MAGGSLPNLMSEELHTIFRRCPNCGKRFEIRITGKKLVDEKVVNNKVRSIMPVGSTRVSTPTPMKEGVTTVDVKEFEYSYECQHCGHKWLELVDKYDESTSWNQPPKL